MNDFTDIVSKAMEVRPDEGDYTGKDGLLYCGKCHTPKEAYFEDGHAALFGRDRHPTNCACQQKRMDEKRLADQQRKHEDTVKELKKDCFDTPKLRDWCFAQDNGANPQMKHARFYADNFDTMLLTNFAAVLNDLSGSFEGRNQYIAHLCRYPLLILDDFGMERGTEYGLEQVYNVIDSRYRSGKPLIVTTNLSLDELQHPQDTPHARIYDRLLEMCAPILFTGTNFRRQTAQNKLDKLKTRMKEKECL